MEQGPLEPAQLEGGLAHVQGMRWSQDLTSRLAWEWRTDGAGGAGTGDRAGAETRG